MLAFVRRALGCAGALAMLTACSGSSSTPPSSSPPSSVLSGPAATASGSASGQPVGRASAKSSPSVAPVTTRVPPPAPGNIHQTVASGTASHLPPVGLARTVEFPKAALAAAVADPARVKAQARIPGELAGPALSFTLQLTNHGRHSLDVGTNIAVTAQDGAGRPFTALLTSTRPVSGTLRPGAHVSGRYVFHLPGNTKNPVTIEVTDAATTEVARFVGPIS